MGGHAFLKWAVLGAGLVTLSGCYVAPPQLVVRPGQGKTPVDFQRDDQACRPGAPQAGAQTGVDLYSAQNQAYVQCMASRGNQVVQVPAYYAQPTYIYGYSYYGPWPYGPYWGPYGWGPYWGPYYGYGPWWPGWGVGIYFGGRSWYGPHYGRFGFRDGFRDGFERGRFGDGFRGGDRGRGGFGGRR